MMVVGRGERYLDMVLDRLQELVDILVVWGDAPDEETEAKLNRPWIEYHRYDESIWATHQPRIKYTLLTKYVFPHKPDWIICQDADEVLDKRITKQVLEEMQNRGEIAYDFYCVQLYDNETTMRVDGGWGNFRNVRYFKPLYDLDQTYKNTPLHCGLAPIYSYQWAAQSEFLFKHYGYMDSRDRDRKRKRYADHDPDGAFATKRFYDSITGSPQLMPFNEDTFGAKLKYEPKRPNKEKILRNMKNKRPAKLYYFQNKYGSVFSTGDQAVVDQWRKTPGVKEIQVSESVVVEAPPVQDDPLQCVVCGFVAKNESGLRMHKRKHEK